ncbi:MAG: hypothetical protein WCE91_11155 [Nitrososphaeraceae archaeon]
MFNNIIDNSLSVVADCEVVGWAITILSTVDKQDNPSVAITNNPGDILLFVLCNCAASNLKLVFEVL